MGYLRCRVVVAKGAGGKEDGTTRRGSGSVNGVRKERRRVRTGHVQYTHTRAREHTPVGPHAAPASFPGFPRIPTEPPENFPTSSFFYVHVVTDVRVEMPPLRLLLVHLVAHAQAGRDRLDALPQRHPLGRVVDLAAAAQVETAVLAVEVGHTGGKEGR